MLRVRRIIHLVRTRLQALGAVSVQATALILFVVVVFAVVGAGGREIGSGEGPHLGLSIAATALLAFTLEPARKIARSFSARLVYGVRVPPRELITEFSERIVRTYAGDEILREIVRMLTETLHAERTTILLYVGDKLEPVASHGVPTSSHERSQSSTEAEVVSIKHGDEQLGTFEIQRARRLAPDELQLLQNLASVASTVVRNLRLRAELQSQVERVTQTANELRSLRKRIVESQDLERRALERNIHDGAQQYLTALNVQIGLAGMLLRRDPPRGREALAKAKSLSGQVLGSIEELAHGIYPQELTENGIVDALRSRSSGWPFQLELAGGSQRYLPEVEAAVYFTSLEALQNAAKHSGASKVRVRIEPNEDGLLFEVVDDGVGFDVASAGSTWLRNMADRLVALGGSVEITSHPGVGTTVSGTVPA